MRIALPKPLTCIVLMSRQRPLLGLAALSDHRDEQAVHMDSERSLPSGIYSLLSRSGCA